MTLDCRFLVDDLEFLGMSGDCDLVARGHAYHCESCASRFPALRTATNVVVCDVTFYPDFDFVALALAVERAAGETRRALLDTAVH